MEKRELDIELDAMRRVVFAAIESRTGGRKQYLKRLHAILAAPNCITVGGLNTAAGRKRAAEMILEEIAQNEPIKRPARQVPRLLDAA